MTPLEKSILDEVMAGMTEQTPSAIPAPPKSTCDHIVGVSDNATHPNGQALLARSSSLFPRKCHILFWFCPLCGTQLHYEEAAL